MLKGAFDVHKDGKFVFNFHNLMAAIRYAEKQSNNEKHIVFSVHNIDMDEAIMEFKNGNPIP